MKGRNNIQEQNRKVRQGKDDWIARNNSGYSYWSHLQLLDQPLSLDSVAVNWVVVDDR